mmetsp:Transcript_23064/g.28322  ORF Transcript_23064/g.28322 Transcript_23064/m.28322 type:complete len:377 (+) Transcript_23064:114-1244(+)|eukprot:CAMPEP_0204840744 /NCGR_PEP_ID=MMETSP1346-20131115/38879_1 /ASSEMBLY_ACC=CAM_ASM_000771 /TAXON_ID=215587 /ORGANISM="Aplanochytrium stocchinoi, Strain GSBS06" /LENGTH=376 /DNA_ID=CAMNT_0051978345 /DNA_START=67 /DNA_END=1197 /DNA_ORIENTATION=-
MSSESKDEDSTSPFEKSLHKRARLNLKEEEHSCNKSSKVAVQFEKFHDQNDNQKLLEPEAPNHENNLHHVHECDHDNRHDHDCCQDHNDDEDGGVETLEVEYWDGLYGANVEEGITSEYLLSYLTLRPFILKITGMHTQAYINSNIKNNKGSPEKENQTTASTSTSSAAPVNIRSGRVLVPGCGDTSFSELLHKDGYSPVYNTDTSPRVVNIMKKKFNNQKGLKWFIDDALCSQFEDSFFDKIIDKSLIDCFYYVKDVGVHVDYLVSKVLSEYYRMLTSDGVIVIATMRTPQEFLPFVDKSISHSVEQFSTRRKEGLTHLPCQWDYNYIEICTEANEENLVAKDVPAYEVTEDFDPDEEFENYATFFIYTLQKQSK